MQFITFILNLPWTIALLIAALFSLPRKFELHHSPFALVIHVHSFWYYQWIPFQIGVRAMTLGNVILMGPKLLKNDYEHEIVHIKQHQRMPIFHPVLNAIETFRYGYKRNRYEREAYSTTNSTYVGHRTK